MKKNIIIGFLALSIICVSGSSSLVSGASMTDYCQVPAFIASVAEPNVLFVDDVSGSMGWTAYQTKTDRDKNCSLNLSKECDDNEDCTRSYGTCVVAGGDHHNYCSLNHDKHCHTDGDCTRNWGTCQATTTLFYGICENVPTKGCNADALSTSSSDCFTDGSCKCTGADGSCIPRKTYEGYFIPDKNYKPVGGEYVEAVAAGTPCTSSCDLTTTKCYKDRDDCSNKGKYGSGSEAFGCTSGEKRYGCCINPIVSGDCGLNTGNWYNYKLMARIDVLRWAVTGGRPASCTGTKTYNDAECDPELWNETGNATKVGSVCNNTLTINEAGTITGGCKLLANDGITIVRAPWSRINEALTATFKSMPVKPKLGVMSYDGSSVRADRVYVGDFLASNSNSATFPYKQFITHLNSTNPSSMTPTGPAMWDAYNYYAQNTEQYGGFPPQTGVGAEWKNPLYKCDGGGSTCALNACARNYVILMSDGEWNMGGKPGFVVSSSSIDTGVTTPANLPVMASDDRSADPVVPAYLMHKGFTNAPSGVRTKVNSVYAVGLFLNTAGELAMQNVAMYGGFDTSTNTWPGNLSNYPVSTTNCANKGSLCTPLPTSSIDWDKDANNNPDTYFTGDTATEIRQAILDAILDILAHVTSGTAASVLASGEGSGANLVQATYYPRRKFYDTSISWIGGLQNLWYYVDPMFTNSSIREDSSSDTTSHILNIKNDGTAPNYTDATAKDYIVQLFYDTTDLKAKAKRFRDTDGDGGANGVSFETIDFENLGNLWEAGKKLWSRAASDRLIYTNLDTANVLTHDNNKFNTTNLSTIRPLLDTDLSTDAVSATRTTQNNQLATNIITWTRGSDISADYSYTGGTESYRSRTVALTDVSGTNVWKLGDIINSTPKIASWVALNSYDKTYGDTTYGPSTTTATPGSFLATSTEGSGLPNYKNRGMVYVGANDGMLHAFKLGKLGLKWNNQGTFEKAVLDKYCSLDKTKACTVNTDCPTGTGTCTSDTAQILGEPGKELWAFIPKNMLPYLKYMKNSDYCHIYGMDLTPYIFDASINIDTTVSGQLSNCTTLNDAVPGFDYWKCKKGVNSWRTILIGGMRLGGACRNKDTITACTDCVKTPMSQDKNSDSDTTDAGEGVGYSSYFALDVTDQNTPKLLWEFANESLGFATTGPAIVRISSRTAGAAPSTTSTADTPTTTNGRWFVVFGSGPTGPINTTDNQFMGKSDQNLRLFILDLKTGSLARTIVMDNTGTPATPTIANAFAGSMINAGHDSDFDYQDNVVYIPYVRKCIAGDTSTICASADGKWNNGGILRLLTNEDRDDNDVSSTGTTALNPNNWIVSTVMDDAGPVTSSVVRLQNKSTGRLWLFAGSGRYFFKTSSGIDDNDKIRHLYGFKEPCFENGAYNAVCLDTNAANDLSYTPSQLADIDLSSSSGVTDDQGWKIALDGCQNSAGASASCSTAYYMTERVITDPITTTTGLVFFTTLKPYAETCTTGGKSAIWAVKYDTGGAGGALLKGKALIQVSTGAIEQKDMSSAFTQQGGRKTTEMEGVPPTAQGLSLVGAPSAIKRVLHIRER